MANKKLNKLNLGCGIDFKEGYDNSDLYAYFEDVIIQDLNEPYWRFPLKHYDEILCQDIIEHLDDIPQVMKNLYLISKPNAVIKIRVPHFLYANAYVDPTHKHFFSWRYFHSFVKNNRQQDKEYGFRFFNKIKVHIEFEKSIFMPWNYIIESLVNYSDLTRDLYERTPLRIFPPKNLMVEFLK
jgi:predicted SAM-dependent methyltransferase